MYIGGKGKYGVTFDQILIKIVCFIPNPNINGCKYEIVLGDKPNRQQQQQQQHCSMYTAPVNRFKGYQLFPTACMQ